MNALEKALHERALEVSSRYRRLESDLLEILVKLDEKKVFRVLGYSSLFQYCLTELKLSESTAYNFIAVARKAREIPEIKIEIKAGNVSVSKVNKVVSVMHKGNAGLWLEKAKTLSRAKLEKEVARVSPKALTPEKSTYVTEKRLNLQVGVNEDLYEKLNYIKDLLSQKLRRPATLEDSLEAMADLYIERHDPLEKAKRARDGGLSQSNTSAQLFPGRVGERIPLSAQTRHAVFTRDQNQCSHNNTKGERCEQKRFLDLHHIRPVKDGGGNEVQNLQMLCFNHHKARHRSELN